MTQSSTATALKYPSSPQHVDPKILEPSPTFRKQVGSVMGSIVLFIATYILLVAAAIVLALACGWAGLALIVAMPKLIVIIFGVGLLGLGIMVIVFLFKFMFKTSKVNISHLTEVKAKDQPVLFEFLKNLARETRTPMPKHVYLSSDVNASVFYDSSFWSMFFPIRKNLQIGLGLVNVVNVSEFKAIIAHEFGHFSQRSMKLGSYVYNVNRVIYNMLYDNDGYSEALSSWGNVHAIFRLFASITVGIVKGIQKILQSLYGVINKRHMALSREMEFHADTVAAFVTGSAPLITSLRRLEPASSCYDAVIDYYTRGISEGLKGDNLYPAQSEVLKHFATVHEIPMQNGYVQVSAESFVRFNKSRIVIKDQWASHPSTDDREEHLRGLNIESEVVIASAWTLFLEPVKLQELITARLYETVSFKQTPIPLDAKAFNEKYYAHVDKFTYDSRYKGFYDGRAVTVFDVNTTLNESLQTTSLAEIITPEVASLPMLISGIENDLQVLEQLRQRKAAINTFEFEGKKCSLEEAPTLIVQLTKELETAKASLARADREVFLFLHHQAEKRGASQEFIQEYKSFHEHFKQAQDSLEELNGVMSPLAGLYQNVTQDTASSITNMLKHDEKALKQSMRNFLKQLEYASLYSEEERKAMSKYADAPSGDYFSYQDGFYELSFERLHTAVGIYGKVLTDYQVRLTKQLLSNQLRFAN